MTNELGMDLIASRMPARSDDCRYTGQTLGHLRRSRNLSFLDGATVDVWMPCWTPWTSLGHKLGPEQLWFRDHRDRVVPHVFFKATMGSGCGSISCPECRVRLAEARVRKLGGKLTTCDACGLPHRDVQPIGAKPIPIQGSLF